MGRSQTINCIGLSKPKLIEGKMQQRVYYAMNRVEIAQAVIKADKEKQEIENWYAQTIIGARILSLSSWKFEKLTKDLILPKLVKCPIRRGVGSWKVDKRGTNRHECIVCNGAGFCKKGNERKWQSWQIEKMKSEVK